MNIAVLAPSPVPFCVGGLERHADGLAHAIRAFTSHQVDTIKLPLRERSLWDLAASYRAWAELDLSHFDAVVSLKYPTWMVGHRHHILHLCHRLRGLYDTYPAAQMAAHEARARRELPNIWGLLDTPNPTRDDLPRLWDTLEALRERGAGVAPGLFEFPGPLARAVVHFLDRVGISAGSMQKFAAISETVKRRAGYFPDGVDVAVVPPGTDFAANAPKPGRSFFTASRLDGAKRIDLIIRAYRDAHVDVPLRIAGDGPERSRLEELCGGDPRIVFLGRVSEEALRDEYASALAVPFIPYDEDFGYITVEAFLSKKPVLTTRDSGGVADLVEDFATGRVVSPEVPALVDAFRWFAKFPSVAEAMGHRGAVVASHISWERSVETLLGGKRPAQATRRRRFVALSTFPVFPADAGGKVRVFELGRRIAKDSDIEFVCATGGASETREVEPGVRITTAATSDAHQARETEISRAVGWTPVKDIAMPELAHESPVLVEAVRSAVAWADVVIAEHPYLWPTAKAFVTNDKVVVHNSHNVEHRMKAALLEPFGTVGAALIARVFDAERAAVRDADLVVACTANDAAALTTLYGRADVRVVENGCAVRETPYFEPQGLAIRKGLLGLTPDPIAVFVASWHPPNIAAAEAIFDIARGQRDVTFAIAGNVNGALRGHTSIPENVVLSGALSRAALETLFSVASVALNPVVSGGGSNLKLADYLAAGVPVVTTPFGARPFGLEHRRHAFIADLATFGDAITAVLADAALATQMSTEGRRFVERTLDWARLAERYAAWICEACAGRATKSAAAAG